MSKTSYYEGWGYSDTIKVLIKGDQANRNLFYKELKNTFPTEDIRKSGTETIEVFVYEKQIPTIKKMATVFKMKIAYKEGGKLDQIETAKIILDQLGGQRKLVMFTGAYNFVAIKNGVTFRIKNRGVNFIQIVLNGNDLYDVTFSKLFKLSLKKVSEHNDVYFDELIPLFEKNTGMYLKFERGGISGDIFSIEDPNLFKQIITIYNEFSEKFGVDNYFLDHNDNSVIFLRKTPFTDTEIDNMSKRIFSLKENQNFDVLNNNKNTVTSGGTFKFFLKNSIKYAEGGMPQGLSIADANPYIAGAKAVQGIAPSSVSALDQRIASRINPDPNRPVFFKTGGKTENPIEKMTKIELMRFMENFDYEKYSKMNWFKGSTVQGLRVQVRKIYNDSQNGR